MRFAPGPSGSSGVAAGSKFSFHYRLRPGVPIDEGMKRSDFVEIIRQHAQGDVEGLKALCEAEARAHGGVGE